MIGCIDSSPKSRRRREFRFARVLIGLPGLVEVVFDIYRINLNGKYRQKLQIT